MDPELEAIVQRMIDANEDEENIASVIKEYPSTKLSLEEKNKIPLKEPTTFSEGFNKSLGSGEAVKTGLRGLKGFAQGAITDLPSNIYNGIKSIGNMIVDPINTMKSGYETLSNLPKNAMNTTINAGSNPEEFGRMMGNMTGQPLVTAGLTKSLPYAPQVAVSGLNKIGKPLEAVGNVVSLEGLASGFLPPLATPRYLKMAERLGGRGVRNIGQKMQGLELPESLTPDRLRFTKEPTTESLPSVKPKVRYANGKYIDLNTGEEVGAMNVKNEFTPWKGLENIKNIFEPSNQIFPKFKGKR